MSKQKKATKNELRIAELLIENCKLKQDLALLKIDNDAHRNSMQHFRGELINRAKEAHTIDARDIPGNVTIFDAAQAAENAGTRIDVRMFDHEPQASLHNVRAQVK